MHPKNWGSGLIMTFVIAAFSPHVSATVYEWQSPSGVRHFSNHIENGP